MAELGLCPEAESAWATFPSCKSSGCGARERGEASPHGGVQREEEPIAQGGEGGGAGERRRECVRASRGELAPSGAGFVVLGLQGGRAPCSPADRARARVAKPTHPRHGPAEPGRAASREGGVCSFVSALNLNEAEKEGKRT